MTRTAASDYLSHISDDPYRALRCPEYAGAGLFPRNKSVAQYLNPGNAKRFVKREPKSRTKGNPIVLDTDTDTAIIASEFLQTDSRGYICIICYLSAKGFLPFIPPRHIKSEPRQYWPEDESPEQEHEKYFHILSIAYMFHHCKRQWYHIIHQTIALSNAIPEA
jgi:hypothetical protein